jgi:hypothetical protein
MLINLEGAHVFGRAPSVSIRSDAILKGKKWLATGQNGPMDCTRPTRGHEVPIRRDHRSLRN